MEFITLTKDHLRWKASFLEEATLLQDRLGLELKNIHHIGSTAIPKLLAKPIIDIAVESTLFPPCDIVTRNLELLGYQYKGEAGIPGRYWFTKGSPRKFNLHYCNVDSAIAKKQIAFRDKLIKSFQLKKKYETIKLENYKDRGIDSAEYASAKSVFIEEVLDSS